MFLDKAITTGKEQLTIIETWFGYLKELTEYVQQVFKSFPLVIVVLLIVAFVIMVVIILITIFSTKTSAVKIPPIVALEDEKGKPPDNRLPPPYGWLGEYLTKKGIFEVSNLSLSFLRALDSLKKIFNVRGYKYKLPWYLLVGSEESGKTTLITQSDILIPIKNSDATGNVPNPECRFWFLSRGSVS
ncbi:MAG: hypothetical protein ACTSXG_00760 [Alphaproteobacteria bacterium]